MKIIFTITFVTLLSISELLSCSDTPPEQIVPASELIKRTKTIVLAKVTSAKIGKDSHTVIYTFKTIEALKGAPQKTFTISGFPMMWEGELTDFDHHNNKEFWKNFGGRSDHDTDCEIHPSFSVGATFLIFLEPPYHKKSFELVIRTHGDKQTRDKWLSWVEAQIRQPTGKAE
jgi:hypothetical protein